MRVWLEPTGAARVDLFGVQIRMMAANLSTGCCIVGGGPAGMMLGFLLARAGVAVTVLEKHGDFLRDFRGDTIHPSTLELMGELGLLTEFLRLPHQEARTLHARFGGTEFMFADFRHLPTRCKFVALMPQWDFLNFLAEQGKRHSGFRLLMRAAVTDLIEADGAIRGVRADTPDGPIEVSAPLTVGCDGRHAVTREKAGLVARSLGAPMDVLWFRLRRKPDDPADPVGIFDAGVIFVLINRGDYWQCGYVIAKGSFDVLRERGLDAFRTALSRIAPMLADRVCELKDWKQVSLLTVAVERLERWHRPGLICIGDAAHAMSPIGGVGINLAVQDAVAAANILAAPLRAGAADEAVLARVQRRRELPTRLIQALQVTIQNQVIRGLLTRSGDELKPPLVVKLLQRFPMLGRIPARALGVGVRPEHIQTRARG
jgi:2-polyprenyl-6-methoxyphenol hydroxylase-like FAD-dependent oxidoreductase